MPDPVFRLAEEEPAPERVAVGILCELARARGPVALFWLGIADLVRFGGGEEVRRELVERGVLAEEDEAGVGPGAEGGLEGARELALADGEEVRAGEGEGDFCGEIWGRVEDEVEELCGELEERGWLAGALLAYAPP